MAQIWGLRAVWNADHGRRRHGDDGRSHPPSIVTSFSCVRVGIWRSRSKRIELISSWRIVPLRSHVEIVLLRPSTTPLVLVLMHLRLGLGLLRRELRGYVTLPTHLQRSHHGRKVLVIRRCAILG